MVGEGEWLTAHQPTKKQAMLPSLSTHPLASSIQKKSLMGVGERRHDNQTAHQEEEAREEVAAQQEATRQSTGQTGDNSMLRVANTSRGREAA